MYRDEISHQKRGCRLYGKFLQRSASKRGVGAKLSWSGEIVHVCVDNVWVAGAVQDQVPYSHGLLLGQMFFFKLRENSNMPYM